MSNTSLGLLTYSIIHSFGKTNQVSMIQYAQDLTKHWEPSCPVLERLFFFTVWNDFRNSLISKIHIMLKSIPESYPPLGLVVRMKVGEPTANKTISWSSRSQLFFKIGLLRNSAIFTIKSLSWNLFSIKFQAQTTIQVFSCEICEFF